MTRNASAGTLAIGLSLDEAGLIVEALAERPFKSVYALIGELNRQANGYDAAEFGADATQRYLLSVGEMQLIVSALGDLPYRRVHRLVHKLNARIAAGPSVLEAAP